MQKTVSHFYHILPPKILLECYFVVINSKPPFLLWKLFTNVCCIANKKKNYRFSMYIMQNVECKYILLHRRDPFIAFSVIFNCLLLVCSSVTFTILSHSSHSRENKGLCWNHFLCSRYFMFGHFIHVVNTTMQF